MRVGARGGALRTEDGPKKGQAPGLVPATTNETRRTIMPPETPIKIEPPDEEFQSRAADWAHWFRVVEMIRRADAGEPPLQLVT